MNWKQNRREVGRMLMAISGSFLYAVGANILTVPMGLYNGGMIGAAQLIRTFIVEVLGINVGSLDVAGIIYYVINIPLFILAFRSMGKGFFVKSLICTTALTFFISILQPPVVPILDDPLAACLIGGIISGAGVGISLRFGASNGGSDILGVYFSKKYKDFSVGRISLIINFIVYGIMAIYMDLEVVIYSIIYVVFMNLALDRVHLQSINVEVQIFTKEDPEELKNLIFQELYRGATTWRAQGGYTNEPGTMIYMIVNKYEVPTVRAIAQKYDSHVFITYNENITVTGNYIRRL